MDNGSAVIPSRVEQSSSNGFVAIVENVSTALDMTQSRALRIFVLADTHNRLPESLAVLAEGADEIWHLGDVCAPAILAKIETFGPPVSVVHGNCDDHPPWPLLLDLV